MLSVEEAQARIIAACNDDEHPIEIESLSIEKCLGRFCADAPISPIDIPPADNSAMDGVCINLNSFNEHTTLPVTQRIPAGKAPKPLAEGEAARIFTGAEIPPGANTVVMQENCEFLNNGDGPRVRLLSTPTLGEHIRKRGQDLTKGSELFPAGTKLDAQHLGLLAAVGLTHVRITRRLRVAILLSGDELQTPGKPLAPGQIYNSNGPMLAGLLEQAGCDLTCQLTVADSPEASRQAIADALTSGADAIFSCGGVSVGEEDHMRAAIEAAGDLAFWKVRVKPGKPLAFGKIDGRPIMGLPGNPASTFVTFLLFGLPMLRALQGSAQAQIESLSLPAAFAIEKAQSRRQYLRASIKKGKVHIHPQQSSGVLSAIVNSNALAVVPEESTVALGHAVQVLPFSHFFA